MLLGAVSLVAGVAPHLDTPEAVAAPGAGHYNLNREAPRVLNRKAPDGTDDMDGGKVTLGLDIELLEEDLEEVLRQLLLNMEMVVAATVLREPVDAPGAVVIVHGRQVVD